MTQSSDLGGRKGADRIFTAAAISMANSQDREQHGGVTDPALPSGKAGSRGAALSTP